MGCIAVVYVILTGIQGFTLVLPPSGYSAAVKNKLIISLFLALASSGVYSQERSSYVIRPNDRTDEFSWSDELKAVEMEFTPGLLLSQDSSQRIKAVLVRSGRERDTGVYWGAVNLANSMSQRSFLEMMPLEHFSSIQVDKTSSLKGNAARLSLSKTKPKNKVGTEVSSFGQGLVNLSIYDKKDKNHFYLSYLRDQNRQVVYDEITDNFVDQLNDEEKYASIGYSKVFKRVHFDILYSNVEKGVPGDIRNPLNRVTEERSLAIVKINTKRRIGRILHQIEGYAKMASNRMNDPDREVDARVKTYQQEEVNFGAQTTHKGRIGRLKLKGGILADRDVIKVKQTPLEQDFSSYSLNRLNPAFSWNWDMFKGSHELSVQQLSFEEEVQSRFNFSNSLSAGIPLSQKIKASGSLGVSRTSPLLTEMFGNNGDYVGNSSLLDEQFMNADLGLSYKDHSFKAKITGFHRLGQNMIANERVTFNKFRPSNIDRVWILGAEVSAEASYGFSTFRANTTFAETLNDSESPSQKGLWVPMRSRLRGSLAWDNDWHWFGTTFQVRSWSSFFSDRTNQIENPGVTLADVSIRSRFKSLVLEAGMMNLFDKTTGNIESSQVIGNSQRALIDHFGNYIVGRHFKFGASYVF